MSTRPLFLLSCTLALIAAEDVPAPTPAETTAIPAAETPPPAAALPAPAVEAAPKPRPAWTASLIVGGGYDSNALLLEDIDAINTSLDGPLLFAAADARWRAIRRDPHRLEFAVAIDADQYSDQDQADQLRYGGTASYSYRYERQLPTATLGAYRYQIDGEDVATSLSAALGWSVAASTWAALPGIELTDVTYDEVDGASGVLMLAAYRHWFILTPGNPRRRVEVSLRGGLYDADLDYESYTTVRPGISMLWRSALQREAGTWEAAARLGNEFRTYDAGTPGADDESFVSTSLSVDGDWWFNRWLAAGGYLTGALRSSNIDGRDYDRFQIGARFTAAY